MIASTSSRSASGGASNRTPSASTKRTTGRAARPVTTIASWPVCLNSTPHRPPLFVDPIPPVSGDLKLAWKRALVGTDVPLAGDVASTSGFSGASGSTARNGFRWRSRRRRSRSTRSAVPSPRPPRNRPASRSSSARVRAEPEVRSTSSTRPMVPRGSGLIACDSSSARGLATSRRVGHDLPYGESHPETAQLQDVPGLRPEERRRPACLVLRGGRRRTRRAVHAARGAPELPRPAARRHRHGDARRDHRPGGDGVARAGLLGRDRRVHDRVQEAGPARRRVEGGRPSRQAGRARVRRQR